MFVSRLVTLNQLQRVFSTDWRYLRLSFRWIIRHRQKWERDIVVGEWINIVEVGSVAQLKVLL
jgi:hypothetical protein